MARIKHTGEWTDTGVPDAEPVKQGPLNVGGVVIQPNATAIVPNWEQVQRSAAIKAWLRVGIIEVVEDDDNEDATDSGDERAELIAQLDALGIKKPAKTSLDKLRKALAEAQNAATPVKLPGLA